VKLNLEASALGLKTSTDSADGRTGEASEAGWMPVGCSGSDFRGAGFGEISCATAQTVHRSAISRVRMLLFFPVPGTARWLVLSGHSVRCSLRQPTQGYITPESTKKKSRVAEFTETVPRKD
jgi:hypothetical protein